MVCCRAFARWLHPDGKEGGIRVAEVSIGYEVEQIIDGKGSAAREVASLFRAEAYSADVAGGEPGASNLPERWGLLVGS